MGRVLMLLWVLIAVVVVAFGYVRLAPSDPAKWHVPPEVSENRDLKFGVQRVIETGPDGLARLHQLVRGMPRTKVLAGSVESGMITYVTRSAVVGFPDYTTAQQEGDILKIFARLRFGNSDFGVNKARVDEWIAVLQAR